MAFPPNVYLIGAQKSGTTTLAYWLSQHPDLCIAESKEPDFFSMHWHRGLDWYREKFVASSETVYLDASTTYTMAPLRETLSSNAQPLYDDVPKRLHQTNPDAKFIYLLRDPIDRAFSGYWHNFSKGTETRSFDDAIRNDTSYLDISNYASQLKCWLEYFPLSSFLVLSFDELKTSPDAVCHRCFEFMEIDPEVEINCDNILNVAGNTNSLGRQLNRFFLLLDKADIHPIPKPLKKYLRVRDMVRRLTRSRTKIEKPVILDSTRSYLSQYFLKPNQELELLTNTKFFE